MRDFGTCDVCDAPLRLVRVQRDRYSGRYPGGLSEAIVCYTHGTHSDSRAMVNAIRAEFQGEQRSKNHWNPRPYQGSQESKRWSDSFGYRVGIALLFGAPVAAFLAAWSATSELSWDGLPRVGVGALAAFAAWLAAVGVLTALERPYKRRWDESERRRIAQNEKVRREREERGDRTYAGLTQAKWRKTLDEFDQSCAYCSKRLTEGDTHRDHFVPFSRGGIDDASNIVPACGDCNRAKRDQMPDAWLAQCRRERKKVNPSLKKWRSRTETDSRT